jgi:hypothetical protein
MNMGEEKHPPLRILYSAKLAFRGWGQWGEMTQALYAHMNNN